MPRGAKTPRTPLSLLKRRLFQRGRRAKLLQDELSDAVPASDVEVEGAQVEEQDHDIAAEVPVDDASADVDAMLQGKAGTRGHPPIGAIGNPDLKVCLNTDPFTRAHDDLFSREEVETR